MNINYLTEDEYAKAGGEHVPIQMMMRKYISYNVFSNSWCVQNFILRFIVIGQIFRNVNAKFLRLY